MRRTIHGARTKGGSVAKLTNNTLIFGIMGGLAPMRNIKASTHVGYRVGDARMHQDIPLDHKRGLVYMMGQNPMGKYMLSRNPQCAGGIGRMASTSSSGAYTTPTRGKKVFIPPVAVLATSDSKTYNLGSDSWTRIDNENVWISSDTYKIAVKLSTEGGIPSLYFNSKKSSDPPTDLMGYCSSQSPLPCTCISNWINSGSSSTLSPSSIPSSGCRNANLSFGYDHNTDTPKASLNFQGCSQSDDICVTLIKYGLQ